ncbi:hypothetical protein AGMMS50276_15920 [Synergistales bacterium]|nr:hypothetical protein AGMMS50276_15920 [Synergistales bacterium]
MPAKTQKLAGADFITAIILMALGAALSVDALRMRVYRTFLISPGFFPLILGALFIFFGLFLIYRSSRRGGYADAARILTPDNIKKSLVSPVFKKGFTVFLLILAYVALLGKIEFVYLSMGYLILTFLFLNAGKWYLVIPVAVIAPVLVQLAFVHLFKIPMP